VTEEPGATRVDLNWGNIVYLNDSNVTLTVHGRKITIFGSPLTPQFGTWAFQHPPIRDVWIDKVPIGTDILLTHGPPQGHLDMRGKGCSWLNKELWRKKPRLVIFGHIHQGRGFEERRWNHVERAYDGVVSGEKGLWSVYGMAIVLTAQSIWFWLTSRREVSSTTLINAAVVAGDKNLESRPATVIEI
jgi:hypothetical protein